MGRSSRSCVGRGRGFTFHCGREREYNEYTVEVELEAGTHFVGVAFLNDYYEPGVADRNLLVDWLELTERQQRHPLIFGWPVLWRILRSRDLR